MVTVSVSVCVVWLCCVGWWKEGRRWNPVPTHSLLFSNSTKGAARLNVPIRRTNRYQQYCMHSQQPRGWKFSNENLLPPPGIKPRTCWTRGRHATVWVSAASLVVILLLNFSWTGLVCKLAGNRILTIAICVRRAYVRDHSAIGLPLPILKFVY